MASKKKLSLTLKYFLPFLLGITAVLVIFLYFDYQHTVRLIRQSEDIQVELVKKSIERDLEAIYLDIKVLAKNANLIDFINTNDSNSSRLLVSDFASFANQKRIYHSIRVINTQGFETVRIDYIGNKIIHTAKDELQDKSDRYYFTQTIALQPNEVFVSPMDLNIEHGRIEKPYRPTLRVGTPLHDKNGNRTGILILNYNAINLLQYFDTMLAGTAGHVSLLNSDGYWIRSHHTEREWGFTLDKQWIYEKVHPESWSYIQNNHEDQ